MQRLVERQLNGSRTKTRNRERRVGTEGRRSGLDEGLVVDEGKADDREL